MEPDRYHQPVLADRIVELFAPVPGGPVIDATFGGGGHSRLLAAAGHEVIAFDRDPDVPQPAEGVTLVGRPFGEMAAALDELGVGEIGGAFFDLGVSSHQLDTAERGFSYRNNGPIDMRMDRSGALTAAEIVNEWSGADIADVIHRYSDERFARRIAEAIVRSRPIVDTATLADVVRDAIPAATRRTGGHPARRTFQALRIAVNDELGELERGLEAALDRLVVGGRCAVISYHSMEDRYTKRRFVEEATGCTCPPEQPVCTCERVATAKLVTRKPIRPGSDEVADNPRARSALLRVLERIAA